MALATLREILKGSVENRYAVGSFNAANHSMAEAILEASEELGTPVILAVAKSTSGTSIWTGLRPTSGGGSRK